MSLLFLRFIRLVVNAESFETCPQAFLHFQVFITILSFHSFFPNHSFVVFYKFSYWLWIFEKH